MQASKRTLPRALFPALSLVLLPTLSRAAVTQTWSADAPTAGLIATSEDPLNPSTSALGVRWDTSSSSHRDISQSFLAPVTTTLDSFTFKLTFDVAVSAGLVDAPFTIKIHEVASASALPDSAGSALLSAQTGVWTVAAGTPAASYITFNLDPVQLAAGTHYSVSFGFDASGPGRNFLVAVRDSAYYPEGIAAGLVYPYDPVTPGTPGAWTSFGANGDFIFYANTTPVPEPSSAALLVGACALAAVAARRRGGRG